MHGQKRRCLVILLLKSAEPLDMYSCIKYLAGFLITLKCMTLNNLEIHFMSKSVFCVSLTVFICLIFSSNYVKKNRDTPLLPVTKMFEMFVSGDIKLKRIFAKVLRRRGVKRRWVVEVSYFTVPLLLERLEIKRKL